MVGSESARRTSKTARTLFLPTISANILGGRILRNMRHGCVSLREKVGLTTEIEIRFFGPVTVDAFFQKLHTVISTMLEFTMDESGVEVIVSEFLMPQLESTVEESMVYGYEGKKSSIVRLGVGHPGLAVSATTTLELSSSL